MLADLWVSQIIDFLLHAQLSIYRKIPEIVVTLSEAKSLLPSPWGRLRRGRDSSPLQGSRQRRAFGHDRNLKGFPEFT